MSQVMAAPDRNPRFDCRTLVADFFAEAEELRSEFEARVGPARSADPARFAWDYWHVPDQYTYLRTAPRRFFDAARYGRLVAALRAWGGEHLGCGQISEPWLSYYIDGCHQELHTDVVQGPFAFVYSLTPWDERTFRGGETVLMRPELLDYWTYYDATRSCERDELVERIPARFNQLLVFDARVPHGAAAVDGTRDPLEGRVAVHGWFQPPRLVVAGALRMTQLEPEVEAARQRWRAAIPADAGLTGFVVVRTTVEPSGSVASTLRLVSTLVSTTHAAGAAEAAAKVAVQALGALELPAAAGPTIMTVPFSAEVR